MGGFKFLKTDINGIYIIEPIVYRDTRGLFMEMYNIIDFDNNGIKENFVQDNISISKKGVLRGLHFQKKNPQGKLVKVIHGEIYDVAVDIRTESKTFGKWVGFFLRENDGKELYIPPGLAHGYLVLSDMAEVLYKCTNYYTPSEESGLIWNDPYIGIEWPLDRVDEIILSNKDKIWLGLNSIK